MRPRERVMRQAFFEFTQGEHIELLALDSKRVFNEAERIRIYRAQDGLCPACLKAGLSEKGLAAGAQIGARGSRLDERRLELL